VLGVGVIGAMCLAEGGWIAVDAIVGAGGGTVLGLLVGSLVRTETWEDASARAELDSTTRP